MRILLNLLKLADADCKGTNATPAAECLRADAVDLAFHQAPRIAFRLDREDLEFEARRASIHDEDRIHGGQAAGSTVARRRASA